MTIVIIGAGAMGCLFGAGISRKHKVVMICRTEEQAEEISRCGLAVYEPDGSCTHYTENITACVSGQYRGAADLIIVLTKTYDTEAALAHNNCLISAGTPVLTLQNGGGNAEKLEKFCSKSLIFIGTTKHNCTNLGSGVIRHAGAGITYIGPDAPGVSTEPILQVLRDAGFETEHSDNILYFIWEKLFVNLSINTFTALIRAPIGACTAGESAWYFMEKLICEAVDVARACGQNFSYLEVLNTVRATCDRVATGYSSMSQDVMHCRRTEIDTINGYVVSQARLHNIPAPYNELVQNLVHAAETAYRYQEMPTCRCRAGKVILKEGQKNTDLYQIIKGSVSVCLHYGQPDEYLLGLLNEGDCFGELGSILGKKEALTITANEDCLLMKIPPEARSRFLSLNPGNAEKLLKMVIHNTELLRVNTSLVLQELEELEEEKKEN